MLLPRLGQRGRMIRVFRAGRKVSAFLPYSPECVEEEFSEVRLNGVLESLHYSGPIGRRGSYVQTGASWRGLHKTR